MQEMVLGTRGEFDVTDAVRNMWIGHHLGNLIEHGRMVILMDR